MKNQKMGLSTVNSLKTEFMNLIKSKNIDEVKALLSKAQKEIASAVGKDGKDIKAKIQKQRTQIERMVAKVLTHEIKRAERFLDQKKRELSRLEARIESSASPKKPKAKKKVKVIKTT